MIGMMQDAVLFLRRLFFCALFMRLYCSLFININCGILFADGADMKRRLYRVWGDLVLLLLLLIGITLLFVDR